MSQNIQGTAHENYWTLSFVVKSTFRRFAPPFCPKLTDIEEGLGFKDESLFLEERNQIFRSKKKQDAYERYGWKLVNVNNWIGYGDNMSYAYF
jgi:hypothetical protein